MASGEFARSVYLDGIDPRWLAVAALVTTYKQESAAAEQNGERAREGREEGWLSDEEEGGEEAEVS